MYIGQSWICVWFAISSLHVSSLFSYFFFFWQCLKLVKSPADNNNCNINKMYYGAERPWIQFTVLSLQLNKCIGRVWTNYVHDGNERQHRKMCTATRQIYTNKFTNDINIYLYWISNALWKLLEYTRTIFSSIVVYVTLSSLFCSSFVWLWHTWFLAIDSHHNVNYIVSK